VRGQWSSASVAKWRRDTRRRRRVGKTRLFPSSERVSSVPRCLESVAKATDAASVADRDAVKKKTRRDPKGEAPLPSQSSAAPVSQLSGASRGFIASS
jgi:hypothetical protein